MSRVALRCLAALNDSIGDTLGGGASLEAAAAAVSELGNLIFTFGGAAAAENGSRAITNPTNLSV